MLYYRVEQALASSNIFQSYISNFVRMSNESFEMDDDCIPLALSLSELLKDLSALGEERKVVSPRKVILALETYAADFDLAREQDAGEALEFLLCALKEEYFVYFNKCILNSESLASLLVSSNCKIISYKENQDNILRLWSHFLYGSMGGTLGSLLSCQTCSFQFAVHYDSFNHLPLPIASAAHGNIVMKHSIKECLNAFSAPEWISDYCCRHCSHLNAVKVLSQKIEADEEIIKRFLNCEDDNNCSCRNMLASHQLTWPSTCSYALKQLRIGHCPEVLCINLKRGFQTTSGEQIKLEGHLSFPFVLDMAPYTFSASDNNRGRSPVQFVLANSKGQSRKQFSPCSPNIFYQANCHAVKSGNGTHRKAHFLKASSNTSTCESLHDLRNDNTDKTNLGTSFFYKKEVMNGDVLPEHKNMMTDLYSVAIESTQTCEDYGNRGRGSSRKRRLLYELISVVEHHGNLQTGHYTIYRRVKIENTIETRMAKQIHENEMDLEIANNDLSSDDFQIIWFKISDSHVERVPETCVLEADASLLFYEKV
eukprot:TRINITY_DN8316_c1_g1_i1.p1 TRINITY_DN8316_c1_g1~~TRINITY_DN8316_c1_g1_i1.p1  ORF type:complete len:539 (-),score=86.33 TRINITY_DN8316_c1_g1_i1:193-1809(-)